MGPLAPGRRRSATGVRPGGRAATPRLLYDSLLRYGITDVQADTHRRDGDVTIYRMPTLSLCQHAAGRAPAVRSRGREEVRAAPMSGDAQDALIHRLAARLAAFGRLPDDSMTWLIRTFSTLQSWCSA